MTLRQEELLHKRTQNPETPRKAGVSLPATMPKIDIDLREVTQQSSVPVGTANYSGADAPAATEEPKASQRPTTRLRTRAPVSTDGPASPAAPVAPETPTGAPAPASALTKPADLEFTNASKSQELLLGAANPENISRQPQAERIERDFLNQALGDVFRRRHIEAQNSGEISAIGSQFIPKDDPRKTGTVTAWQSDVVPNGSSETNEQIISRITGVTPQMAREFSVMMERQGLPMAVTKEDLVRGMELFKESLAAAESKWNDVRSTLPVGHAPEDEAQRKYILGRAASELVTQELSSASEKSSQSGPTTSNSTQSQETERPTATRSSAWSKIAGVDARIGREQLGQFMTPEQQDALASVQSANPDSPMAFSQAMVRSLAVNEFGERYWKRWSSELQAEKRGAGPITPGREGFWTGGETKVLDRNNPEFTFVVQELEKRRVAAEANGENPSVYALRVRGGNVSVDRAALVATLTGRSYDAALRFDEAMSVTLDGQAKYDFGAPGMPYTQLGQQMSRYMNDFDQSVNKSIERLNKLNRNLGDRSSDNFDYKDDERAVARFSRDLHKDITDSQKAHRRALENAAGEARRSGFFGFGTRGIFINPFPGRPPIL